jgi:shikimate kinase
MKIFLIGFMGSGKTHWGRLLSEKLRIRFFDLDEHITEQAGKTITEIFATEGEEQFRLLEKEAMYIITESHDSFVMATGGGAPCYFNNIEYMNQAGITVWLNTALPVIFERLSREKQKRPLIKELTDDQLDAYISKKFADRRIYYEQAGIIAEEDEPGLLEKIIQQVFHA